MANCLSFRKANCKNCYKCIRYCPVKSIKFDNMQANIIEEECILCGHCFTVCPQNAKQIRNDVPLAKKLLLGDLPVYASIAPSFVAHYENVSLASMQQALRQLGFAGAEETALGATIVKKYYDDNVAKQEISISSCCHTINLLIQRYYPQALPYLSHIVSPMQAHALDIKRRQTEAQTIFIGPCISKKAEAESYPGIVDCVLTFEELDSWLQEQNIAFASIEDDSQAGLTRFFPTTGGILKSMQANQPGYTYLAVDGIENCTNVLKDIIAGKIKKCFIEMSACTGSCIGGPVMEKNGCSFVHDYICVQNFAGKEDFSVNMLPEVQLNKKFPPLKKRQSESDEKAIVEVLRKIGKFLPEHELNCGGCGYNTCREKAQAVIDGKANLEMCLPYLNEKASSFSDTIIQNTPNAIIVLNEKLELQQINQAACELMNIHSLTDVLGDQVFRILDPTPFIKVSRERRDHSEKYLYLPEYQKYVDQTILYDKTYQIIICIMRNVTEEVKQRESKEAISRRTIEIADKVIEKQMRSVQEIASLLGETTAETKVALTRLKESLGDEQ